MTTPPGAATVAERRHSPIYIHSRSPGIPFALPGSDARRSLAMATNMARLMHSLLQHAADKLHEPAWQPPTDVYRTRDGWLVKFDLAGVRPEDIHLSVRGSQLTVSGTRRDWCREEGCSYQLMEISYSHFERGITLPDNLERARVTTDYRYGMLLVRIQGEANK
jgi:HSP20 family protein